MCKKKKKEIICRNVFTREEERTKNKNDRHGVELERECILKGNEYCVMGKSLIERKFKYSSLVNKEKKNNLK